MTANETKDKIKALIMASCRSNFSGKASTIPVDRQTWNELKPKQIRNIEARLGKYFNEETMVLFLDTTITGSGKAGILFTTDGVISTDFDESGVKGIPPMILYRDLCSIRQGKPKEHLTTRTAANCYVSDHDTVAEYRDGSLRVVYTSIYTQFIVNAVRRILKALYRDEAAAPQTEMKANDEIVSEPAEVMPEAIPSPAASNDLGDEDLDNIMELWDENGDPVYFEFLDLIRYENREYVVLLPVDDNKEPTGEEIIILEIVPDPDNDAQEQYLPVDDEGTLMAVFELFRDKFKDLIDFQEPEAVIRADHEDGSDLPYPYDGGENFIFISYSHKDTDKVMGIIRQLQADGYRVWYDEGIDPGTEWDDNSADHVARCGCFLAFMSGEDLARANCKDELTYARDLNLPRLLIYLEDVALTGGLAMRHNRLQALHYYKYLDMKGMFYKRLYESSVFVEANVK